MKVVENHYECDNCGYVFEHKDKLIALSFRHTVVHRVPSNESRFVVADDPYWTNAQEKAQQLCFACYNSVLMALLEEEKEANKQ